jgi:hypothetical protein
MADLKTGADRKLADIEFIEPAVLVGQPLDQRCDQAPAAEARMVWLASGYGPTV